MKQRSKKKARWWRRMAFRTRRFLHGRWTHGAILAACVGLVVLSILLPADEAAARHLGLRWHLYCFFNDAFGMQYTPADLIRSFAALSDGDWRQAMHYHPIGPVAFAFVLFQIPYRTWGLILAPRPLFGMPRLIHAVFAAAVLVLIVTDWLFPLGGKVF